MTIEYVCPPATGCRLLLAEVGILDGSSPHAVSYASDADGVRKRKSSGGVFTEYLTDKNRPFE